MTTDMFGFFFEENVENDELLLCLIYIYKI
jgi:hypothetical protein